MILGLAGNLLKSLGGKKKKISGEKMAQNVMNDSKEKESVAKSSPSGKNSDVKGADLTPLEDIRDDMKASSKKSKDPLNLALDGIDSALFGIIYTLTKTNLLKKKIKSDENKVELDKKKSIRERFLEGASKFVKASAGAAKGVVGNTWDKIMRFLTWTLIGAIVNAIVKNWDEIQKQIQKAVDDLKDLWDSPIMKIFRDFGMWIMTEGLGLTKKIDPKDIDKMKEDTDNLKKELGIVEQQYKDIDKKIKNGSNNESSEVESTQKDQDDIKKEDELESFLSQKKDGEIPLKEGEIRVSGDVDDHQNPKTIESSTKVVTYFWIPDATFWFNNELISGGMFINGKRVHIDTWNNEFRLLSDKQKLEKYGVNKTVTKTNTNQLNTSLFNKDISSYTVGIKEYYFDTESSIILFSQENETGMNYFDSDINFDYKMPETTLNIKELFLLEKLNK